MRIKFVKTGDMIYISHLDVQRLLQRAFRRADIELSFSQGFNPHPKMSYGNALALGVESYGEYVDIEIEDNISSSELLERINKQLPSGMEFIKCIELVGGEKSLAANIELGKYEFVLENINKNNSSDIEEKINTLMNQNEIMITKKNKKGKFVDVDIKPMIKDLFLSEIDEERMKIKATLSTGSKENLNTNVFIPKLLEVLEMKMDHLDVDIFRDDLYFVQDGELVTPI